MGRTTVLPDFAACLGPIVSASRQCSVLPARMTLVVMGIAIADTFCRFPGRLCLAMIAISLDLALLCVGNTIVSLHLGF